MYLLTTTTQMTSKITKKRKLEDGTAADTAIELDEYVFLPIQLKTLQQNLESIPYDILIRTIASVASKDLSFIEKLNEEVPKNITPNTVTKTTKFHDDADQHLLADKQDPNNSFEVRQYHPTKISDFISLTFDAHKFFGTDWPYEEDINGTEKDYNKLIKSLNKLTDRARLLHDLGEHASAYIIIRVMRDEIDEKRIESNGKLDEDEWDTVDPSPDVFCGDLEVLYNEIKSSLTVEEKQYCKERLAAYNGEKPSELNNAFVIANFPWDLKYIKKKYPDHFVVSDRYVNHYTIKSKTKPLPRCNNYVILAEIAETYTGESIKQELSFTDKTVLSYKCSNQSCHNNFCKHLTGLAVQICSEKAKLLLYMSGQTSVQANVTKNKKPKPQPQSHPPKSTIFSKPLYLHKTPSATVQHKPSVQANRNNSASATTVRPSSNNKPTPSNATLPHKSTKKTISTMDPELERAIDDYHSLFLKTFEKVSAREQSVPKAKRTTKK